MTIDSTLGEIVDSFAKDLLERVWELNGWPEEMQPEMKTEAVQYRDIEQIAAALRDMAAVGAVIDPNDPAVAEVRALLGLSAPENELGEMAAMTGMRPEAPAPTATEAAAEPEMPESDA